MEEWTPEWRARDREQLVASLAERAASATETEPLTAARIAMLDLSREPAVAAGSLRADDATLLLVFSLYLRGAPSPDEIRAIVHAFRRHFPEPVAAFVEKLPSGDARPSSLDDDVLDEATAEPGFQGAYGVKVDLLAAGHVPPPSVLADIETLTPCLLVHVAGPSSTHGSAACVEVKRPVSGDAAALRAFALEAARAVPLVSGYAGYRASAKGVEGVRKVHAWSRRFLGIDVHDFRLEGKPLRDSVKNAGWLTLLGTELVEALHHSSRRIHLHHLERRRCVSR